MQSYKTEIFDTYKSFQKREDKSINGVSPDFAKKHPDYVNENKYNKGCWDCYDCSGCSGCSGCHDCYDCSYCSCCSRCSGCYGCTRCDSCTDLSESKKDLTIPKIENIHSKILEAVNNPNSLDISNWHTCDATHCRAGWVTYLAGKEGKDLEEKTSTAFAAMMIYEKSSTIKVPPTRFYDSNEKAMEDIKRCAELEVKEV